MQTDPGEAVALTIMIAIAAVSQAQSSLATMGEVGISKTGVPGASVLSRTDLLVASISEQSPLMAHSVADSANAFASSNDTTISAPRGDLFLLMFTTANSLSTNC